MRSLPLFHSIGGQPVIVVGSGEAAAAKRRLVERAGGIVIDSVAEGLNRGARLAFVAHDDAGAAETDAAYLRTASVLVNVADRPGLCDFTLPSVLERDPVLIAVGTGGASAGLAKALRLRLERLLPQSLGSLAERLAQARARMRSRWPDAVDRRRALDGALDEGGALDPFADLSVDAVEDWLTGTARPGALSPRTILLNSDDPDDLTLRQARLLGSADAIMFDPAVPAAILDRARADAQRIALPCDQPHPRGLVVILKRV